MGWRGMTAIIPGELIETRYETFFSVEWEVQKIQVKTFLLKQLTLDSASKHSNTMRFPWWQTHHGTNHESSPPWCNTAMVQWCDANGRDWTSWHGLTDLANIIKHTHMNSNDMPPFLGRFIPWEDTSVMRSMRRDQSIRIIWDSSWIIASIAIVQFESSAMPWRDPSLTQRTLRLTIPLPRLRAYTLTYAYDSCKFSKIVAW